MGTMENYRSSSKSALLKRWLAGTHQGAVRASHISFYLDEITFRFNRKASLSCVKLVLSSDSAGCNFARHWLRYSQPWSRIPQDIVVTGSEPDTPNSQFAM